MGCWDELFQWPLANGISRSGTLAIETSGQVFLQLPYKLCAPAHGFDLMFIPSVVGKQAVWSSGMILPQNARGPGCNSHNSPFRGIQVLRLIATLLAQGAQCLGLHSHGAAA